jgi:urease accessory protein
MRLSLLTSVLLASSPAFAHETQGMLGGFASGFRHPIFGYDHLLAMLAVGIWGAQIGGRSIWMLPVVFPLIMAIGGFLGAAGIPLPYVEILVALSVFGLGLAIALALKPVEWMSIIAVGLFAVFHGHAHGTEAPEAADPLAYGIGFVMATGLIHLTGIGFGLLVGSAFKGWVARSAGILIALAGVYFLVG